MPPLYSAGGVMQGEITINQNSVFDVYTGTVRGNIGFNSFSTFDVYSGTTVNLHLPDHTGKLINVVRDKTTNIDGLRR